MTFLGYVFAGINLFLWLLMLIGVLMRKPGQSVSVWTAGEISFWRSACAVVLTLGVAVLLGACGGGDAHDQHKHDPSPNCAMRPESCK